MTGRRTSATSLTRLAAGGLAVSRLLTVATLIGGASLGVLTTTARADDSPCALRAVARAEISKAFLTGPAHESAVMSVRLLPSPKRDLSERDRSRACPRVRNVVTITDTRSGQSSYARGQGWGATRADMDLHYFEPGTSDPSAAPWITSGVVTVRFQAYREAATTPIWCRLETWFVTSAGAQRIFPTQLDCLGLPG